MPIPAFEFADRVGPPRRWLAWKPVRTFDGCLVWLRFRKKPVEIEAIRYTGENLREVGDAMGNLLDEGRAVASEVSRLVARLADYYATPAEVALYLTSPHPQLGGETAIDLIAAGR